MQDIRENIKKKKKLLKKGIKAAYAVKKKNTTMTALEQKRGSLTCVYVCVCVSVEAEEGFEGRVRGTEFWVFGGTWREDSGARFRQMLEKC